MLLESSVHIFFLPGLAHFGSSRSFQSNFPFHSDPLSSLDWGLLSARRITTHTRKWHLSLTLSVYVCAVPHIHPGWVPECPHLPNPRSLVADWQRDALVVTFHDWPSPFLSPPPTHNFLCEGKSFIFRIASTSLTNRRGCRVYQWECHARSGAPKLSAALYRRPNYNT